MLSHNMRILIVLFLRQFIPVFIKKKTVLLRQPSFSTLTLFLWSFFILFPYTFSYMTFFAIIIMDFRYYKASVYTGLIVEEISFSQVRLTFPCRIFTA